MSAETPLDDIHADAIRYRLLLRNEAGATLQALIARILRSMAMPENSTVRIEPDGSMVAVAPDDKAS